MKLLGIIGACGFLLISGPLNAEALNSSPYQVCFSPGENCMKTVVNALEKAQKTIDVETYGFNSNAVVKALVGGAEKGVKVRIILDSSRVPDAYSVINMLHRHKVLVMVGSKTSMVYNRVIIIDDKTVVNSSFNASQLGQDHPAENTLIIAEHNLAQAYVKNFNQRWSVSQTPDSYCMSSTKCKLSSLSNKAVESISNTSKRVYDGTKQFWHQHVDGPSHD